MSFTITNAADFKVGKSDRVLVDMIENVQIHDVFGLADGIKGAGIVPDMQDGSTQFKDGSFTGVNAGGIAVADVAVTNALFTLEESYDSATLAKTVFKLAMKKGVNPEDFPAKDAVLEIKQNAINKQYNKACYLGDSEGTGYTLSDKVDGVVKLLTASDDTKWSGVAATALTSATALTKVTTFIEKLFSEVPAVADEQVYIHMSPSNFRIWFAATYGLNGIVNANTLNGGKMPMMQDHPAYNNVTIISAIGLTGDNAMIGSRPGNMLEVVDGDAETDFVSFFFNQATESFLLHIALRLGTAVARYNEVLMQGVDPNA